LEKHIEVSIIDEKSGIQKIKKRPASGWPKRNVMEEDSNVGNTQATECSFERFKVIGRDAK